MASLEQDLFGDGYELRETHISRVFLGADVVYKIKKPVRLGFLDFSTLELRKRFCEAELELNRRLAPDVYQAVIPITRDAAGRHALGGQGEPVEWAVQMRRLPDRDAADVRLREGRLGGPELDRIAKQLARFHEGARADAETAQFGSPAAIETNVRENFEQTRESAVRFLRPEELAAVERWQLAFLREQGERLSQRVQRGRIRDGHGDLRLAHCYLDDSGSVQIIDCIEFNDRFRYGDVCADVAFLAMDLAWHERGDLSELFLAAYARESGDYDLYGVIDFYESYRAYVRGKVSSLLQDDPGIDAAARQRAGQEARKYYLLAEACTREPLEPPMLFAIGGVIASGKSTIAERLGARLAVPVIDSDRTRKQLAGVGALSPLREAPFSGHYSAQASEEVYAELLRRAEVVLRSGRSAVLDASFRARGERRAALELARRCGVPFLFVECVAPADVCRARLAQRERGPSVSDGRLEVFDAFLASYEPVDELLADHHLRVSTTGDPQDAVDRIAARVAP